MTKFFIMLFDASVVVNLKLGSFSFQIHNASFYAFVLMYYSVVLSLLFTFLPHQQI